MTNLKEKEFSNDKEVVAWLYVVMETRIQIRYRTPIDRLGWRVTKALRPDTRSGPNSDTGGPWTTGTKDPLDRKYHEAASNVSLAIN